VQTVAEAQISVERGRGNGERAHEVWDEAELALHAVEQGLGGPGGGLGLNGINALHGHLSCTKGVTPWAGNVRDTHRPSVSLRGGQGQVSSSPETRATCIALLCLAVAIGKALRMPNRHD